MKSIVLAAALALVSFGAPAFAAPASPKAPTPPVSDPSVHTVEINDSDLQALIFAIPRAGRDCSPQDEGACRAQIILDDLAKRLSQQLATKPAAPAPVAAHH
jgi:hypothetical protein